MIRNERNRSEAEINTEEEVFDTFLADADLETLEKMEIFYKQVKFCYKDSVRNPSYVQRMKDRLPKIQAQLEVTRG